MTPNELVLQKNRIEAAELLSVKIDNMERFCQVVVDEINNIRAFELTFYGKDDEESIGFCELEDNIAREFAKLAMEFIKEKMIARKAQYSKI